MNKKTLTAIAAVLAIGVSGLAVAAPGFAREGYGPGRAHMQIDFSALDADGDGKITEAEIAAERARQFAAEDTDGDGYLSKDEIVAAMVAKVTSRVENRVAHMMVDQDSDEDGKISLDEMTAAGPGAKMFAHLDADGDGAISEDEFETALAKRMGRHGDERKHGGKRWMQDDDNN